MRGSIWATLTLTLSLKGEGTPHKPSFPRRRESLSTLRHWIPAFAGMTAFGG